MITLTITLDQHTGELRTNGPITDKVLCLGMLEMAKQQVLDYDPTKPKVLAARADALPKPNGAK